MLAFNLLYTIIVSTISGANAFMALTSGPAQQFTNLTLTMTVPPFPTGAHPSTYFLWPGISPGGASRSTNFLPISQGVLQPVLQYGDGIPNCQVGPKPAGNVWTVGGKYVNTYTTLAAFTGCRGGAVMLVNPGDQLLAEISLVPGTASTWIQKVTNLGKSCNGAYGGVNTNAGCHVDYTIDLLGQSQGELYVDVELYDNAAQNFESTFSNISFMVNNATEAARLCTSTGTTMLAGRSETCTGYSLNGSTCFIQQCVFANQASAVTSKTSTTTTTSTIKFTSAPTTVPGTSKATTTAAATTIPTTSTSGTSQGQTCKTFGASTCTAGITYQCSYYTGSKLTWGKWYAGGC
ncbi:UNVERIFIED_CONTAM: hypothetical protein HDU68_001307 [Siphonaria sp. JEL0065]|nr:hypothetical protein HDU68_001307 [Siphonaria sp. JEL0065]